MSARCNNMESGSLTTADNLYKAVGLDVYPEDPDVLADYGFNRFVSRRDRVALLALYRELMCLDVPSQDLDQWRTQGTLVENITKTFDQQSPDDLGPQYHWFVKNKIFLDRCFSDKVARKIKTYVSVLEYLTPEDRAKYPYDLPRTKSKCLAVYAVLSHGCPLTDDDDPWPKCGFCICKDAKEVALLATLIRRLIFGARYDEGWEDLKEGWPTTSSQTCTFADFVAAYEDAGLAKLLRSKAVAKQPHEEVIVARLEQHFADQALSLQNLTTFLAMANEAGVPPGMLNSLVKYGFALPQSLEDRGLLKQRCRLLLERVDPSLLYHAAKQGTILRLAKGEMKMDDLLAKLLPKST